MNIQQRECFQTIIQATTQHNRQETSSCFFLQGPAGTGKTFLYKCLCAYFRSQGKIVLCVASSGIAAQLLPGGRTAHSRFKIPLSNDLTANCNIAKNSELADLIRQTELIIWDEVPMQHQACFEAVNRTLNDLGDSEPGRIFGGIPIILGGDFAQILPVVRRGSKQATILACIQHASIWSKLKILRLTQNMHIIEGTQNQQYLQFLHSLTYNEMYYGQPDLPSYIHCVHTTNALCSAIYPPELLHNSPFLHDSFKGRSSLSYTNDAATEFNQNLIAAMPGDIHEFYSVNSLDINDEATEAEPLPAEYLQSIELPSLPPAILKLKVGAPAILLRNLSPKEGMCNGTRIRIVALGRNCLKVAILGGAFDGMIRLISRIKLTSFEDDLPFLLTRKQFPIRLCFAMTVNKS